MGPPGSEQKDWWQIALATMPHGGVVGAEDTPPADGDCNIALRDQKGTGTGEGLMRIQRLGFFDGLPGAALKEN